MKTIINILIIVVLIGYILSTPVGEKIYNILFSKSIEQIDNQILPPKFDIGVVVDILETAVLKQSISITFDTILNVSKTYHVGVVDLMGYHKPLFKIKTEARLYYKYDFVVKTGYKMEENDILKINIYNVDDSIFVNLPPSKILTVELKKTSDKLEGLNTNNKLVINQKYITQTQRNMVFNHVKNLCIKELYKNNILQKTDIIGKEKIERFLQSVNPNYKIIVL